MHIKWRQFFREVNSPSVTVLPFWSLIDKEAGVLLDEYRGGKLGRITLEMPEAEV